MKPLKKMKVQFMAERRAFLKNKFHSIIAILLLLLVSGCGKTSNAPAAGAGSIANNGQFTMSLPTQLQKHRTGLTAEVEAVHIETGKVRITQLLIADDHQISGALSGLEVGGWDFTIRYQLSGVLVATKTIQGVVVANVATSISFDFLDFPDNDNDHFTNLDEVIFGANPNDSGSTPLGPNGVIDTPIDNVTVIAGQSLPFTATVTDTGSGGPFSFVWDFGGGAPNQSVEDPGIVTFNTPGLYIITFSVTDAVGHVDSEPPIQTIRVTERNQSLPVITSPTEITVNATSIAGISASNIAIQVFLSGASAIDDIDGTISAISENAPATFPVGTTIVTFIATDSAGNTGTATSTVTVLAFDVTSPVVTVSNSIVIAAEGTSGTAKSNTEIQTLLSGASAEDNVDGPITTITNDAPARFPVGDTVVTFTATDLAGNTGTTTATVTVSVFQKIRPLSAGYSHNCAILSDGRVTCWGRNSSGQLGDETLTGAPIPVLVTGITNAIALSAGRNHSCAVLTDGRVTCWGENLKGQLGDGTFIDSTTPILVNALTSATEISAGFSHSCALLSDGRIKCWGGNDDGQLGDGTFIDSTTPVLVKGLTSTTAISAGRHHSCALLLDGRVKCWGDNDDGQLGDGTLMGSLTPVLARGFTDATAISAGKGKSSCALLAEGRVKCWGKNTRGQLGNGTLIGSSTPVLVSGITNAVAVSAGDLHGCVLLSDGKVHCWGDNSKFSGQLGNGTFVDSTTPVPVTGITDATAISAGSGHSCVLLAAGGAKCWGTNDRGELGNGTMTPNSAIPVEVIGLP